MELRPATPSDASAIARLHANSWRFAYRGALSNEYLDFDADRGRLCLGCGTRLMSAVKDCCSKLSPASPVYLWVLDTNRRAQAFYSRLGATFRGTDHWKPPDGGTALLHRFAWNSPGEILLAEHNG